MTDRRSLPQRADDVPPLGAEFDEALAETLAELDITLQPRQVAALEVHARLLLAWNQQINLTAIRDPVAVARLHIADSLSTVPLLESATGAGSTLLDLGSGGGYPGLPLAIALPLSRVALVDSVAKKVRFLDVAAEAVTEALSAEAIGVEAPAAEAPGAWPREGKRPHIAAVRARAEELARSPGERERWNVVTARAVGALVEVAELGLPLLRRGGVLVAWKRDPEGSEGRNVAAEVAAARGLIQAAGGTRPRIVAAAPKLLPGHVLVTIEKVRPTPKRFPRDPAERQRSVRS